MRASDERHDGPRNRQKNRQYDNLKVEGEKTLGF